MLESVYRPLCVEASLLMHTLWLMVCRKWGIYPHYGTHCHRTLLLYNVWSVLTSKVNTSARFERSRATEIYLLWLRFHKRRWCDGVEKRKKNSGKVIFVRGAVKRTALKRTLFTLALSFQKNIRKRHLETLF